MDMMTIIQSLADFFDGLFLAILIGTGILFLVVYITWWIYKTLSTRDVFQLYHKKGDVKATTGDHILYALKYFIVFPVYTFIGFLIFAFSLFLLMKPEAGQQETMMLFIAIVIISTIRVSAYVNEQLAEDLAKLLPLAMISVIITHPTLTGIGVTWEQLTRFITAIPNYLKYLLFTIILEGTLRGGSWVYRTVRDRKSS